MGTWFGIGMGIAAGAFLAVVHFSWLWYATRRLPEVAHPAPWHLVHLMLRLAVTIAGFYLLLRNGHWDRGLAAVLGFTVVRLITIRRVGAPRVRPSPAAKGSQWT